MGDEDAKTFFHKVATIDSEVRLLRPPNGYRRWPDQDNHLFLDFGGEADLRSYPLEGLHLT
jgi:hypothetical protein